MSWHGTGRAHFASRTFLALVAGATLCMLASAAPNRKPAANKKPAGKQTPNRTPNKNAPSALTKTIDARMKKAQAALKAGQNSVQATAGPIAAAKQEYEATKESVAEAKRALREIESNLDDQAEPDSPYGMARQAYRNSLAQYEKVRAEAEAAAKARQIKDSVERLAFMRKYEPLVVAHAKRVATTGVYSKQRQEAIEQDSQWRTAKNSLQKHQSRLDAAEQKLRSVAAKNASARRYVAAATKEIAELQQAKRVSQAQDKQRAALAKRQAEQRRRAEADRRKKQNGQHNNHQRKKQPQKKQPRR